MKTKNVTIVETNLRKKETIAIRPFFDERVENMGLEKYGMTLFDNVTHNEPLACIEMNGITRYITGLNEFAPEIKKITNIEEREAKIKEIRNTVAQLEKDLASNIVDPESPDFWNKVILLKPDNAGFWNKIHIAAGNQPIFLDPIADPYDLIKLTSIKAGGFTMIAGSLEEARTRSTPPKFYLDKSSDSVSTRNVGKKVKNRASGILQDLFDTNTNKLFYVAKVVDPNSPQYKKNTPNDIIYENMDAYISGKGVDTNVIRAAQHFIDTSLFPMDVLKVRALIKDATFYKILAVKGDGNIYHVDSQSIMGKNVEECVEFLLSPLNEEVLINVTSKVERYWNE